MRLPIKAIVRRCAIVLAALAGSMAPALSQELTEVRVITAELPPFVMKEGSQLTGFSIDLWNEVAARLKISTKYELSPAHGELMDFIRRGDADVLVGATFFTSERDKEFDFSHPILEAGLQVMVREQGGVTPTPLKNVFNLLFSTSAAIWLAVALIIIVVPAHVIWWLDRGREEGISPDKRYYPGILHSLVWATTALVSQVQLLPNQWLARVLGLLWMFAGVVFIALYTAELTANLTIEKIQGSITGPADLPGKRVATITRSTAAEHLKEIGAQVLEYSTVDEVTEVLLNGEADAVFGGAPSLRYFAEHEGSGQVAVVGPEIVAR
jgi:polar amino acid transport system substrate-binding protein